MDELGKLYDAVSGKFDIGTKEEFSTKMGDVESRKRFYDSVSGKGFDLGDYDQYESRLSTNNTPVEPKGANAVQSGESKSVSVNTPSSSDSKQFNPQMFDPNKDYQGMQAHVDKLRRDSFNGDMKQDKEFQKKLSELEATGNTDAVESLKQSYIDEAVLKNSPESDLSKKIKENFKDAPVLETRDETFIQTKYRELSERSDFKYKDQKVYEGTAEKEGVLTNVGSDELVGVYGDVGQYGIDVEDFNSYIESGNDRIKKLSRAGYFTDKTDDVLLSSDQDKSLREAAKNQALMGYVGDRLTHLKGKHLGLVKQGKIEDAVKVEAEILKTAKGYQDYVSENLPNYKKVREDKLTKEYLDYSEDQNIGQFKKALTTTGRTISSTGKGIMNASGDASAYLLDLVGADDSAEHQRMINDYNKEFDNDSLLYGVVSGKKVFHDGKNYLTTDSGRIIDTDSGKEVTAIVDKLKLDKDAILQKGQVSNQEDTSYSPSGLVIKGAEVLGNLAFQLASTRGVGGAVGATGRVGTITTSMAVQSGMVASSVYEETLSQLRKANINDELAKGEALELSMKMGAVTALTSVLSPNSSALGMTTKSVDKGLASKLASSYVSGGKEAFKTALWKQVKDKGIAMTREGLEESLQELTEMVAQKGLNSGINDTLGKNILDTEISKDEVIETFILSHATAGMMAANAKTSGDFKDKLAVMEHLSKDVEQSTSFIKSFKEEGAISEGVADKMIKDITRYAKYSNKLPNDVTIEKVEPLLEALDKRNNLENRKKNEDKAFHVSINEQILAVDESINKILTTRDAKRTDIKEATPEQYARSMSQALKNQNNSDKKINLQVDELSQEQAQKIVDDGGKLFMTSDRKAGGYVMQDGYMGGLFKNPESNLKNVAKVLQEVRVQQGGKYFDAYGTKLEDIYIKNGFKPVARLKFNEEFADEGWDDPKSPLKNKPDVVFFTYDPKGSYKKGDGQYFTDYDQAKEFTKNINNESNTQGTSTQNKEAINQPTGTESSKQEAANSSSVGNVQGGEGRVINYKNGLNKDVSLNTKDVHLDQSEEGTLLIKEKSNRLGHIKYTKKGDEAIINLTGLFNPTLEGKGLGTIMYIKTAEWLKSNSGLTLVSDTQRSPQAEKLWKKLEDQGKVSKVGNVYKFKRTSATEKVSAFKNGEIKHISTFLTKAVSEEVHEDISKYREVFTNDRVYTLAKKAGVRVVLLTDKIKNHPLLNVEGGKYLGDGVILINPKYINKKYLGTNTIQHESAHAYTSAVLLSKSVDNLTDQERVFKRDVETIFKSKKTFLNRDYGFKSSSEFIAEFLSNDKFKSYVKGEDLSFYEKVKQLVAKFINKQTDLDIEDVIGNFENYLQGGLHVSSQEQTGGKNKKIKESSSKLASNIRKLKVNSSIKDSMSRLNSRPTAIFEAAWDGAIEAVATTVELTGDFTQAMNDGINSLKESSWYKSISEGNQRKAERMFKEDLNRQFNDDSGKDSPSFKDSVKATAEKLGDVFTQKIVDKYHILRKELKNNFNIYNDSVDFSQAEILMHGKAANELEMFDKKVETVIKKIASKDLTVDNVSDFLYAKHAEERNQHVKKNIDSENEFGSGMTPQEIDRILNKTFTEDQIKDLEVLSKDLYDIIEGTRQVMMKRGLISQEQYNTFTDYYENYVPLQGFQNEDIDSGSNLQGNDINISGAQAKRSAGRSTRADNVIANIISQRVKATIQGHKNEVLHTLYKLASENKDNGVVKVYNSKNLPKSLKVSSDGTKVNQPENPQGRKDYVGVKVDGEQFYLKFANKELGRVLNAANIEKTDLVTKTLGKFNRYLSTTLTTLDPEFVISNFARDIQTAVFNISAESDINEALGGKSIAKQVVKDTGKSIKAIYANERKGKVDKEFEKYYNEFKEDGAKTGWANQNNLEDVKKKLENIHKMSTNTGLNKMALKKGAKDLFQFVEDVNTSVENGVRLSAYVNARRVGATRNQAAKIAKELTVNFNQSGEWGTVANSLYLFFNAAVQGNVRFLKAMATMKKTINEDGTTKRSLNKGQKIALSMVAFSSLVTMLNQAVSDDDEDGMSFYKKIPDYEKERNLIFMNPATGKDYFKIPLPYGYNIFHNMGTITTEVSTGDRTVGDGIGFLTGALIGAFSPISFGNTDDASKKVMRSATPTILKPILDLSMNEDFFGSKIYNENFPFSEPVPDAARGRKTTPAAFKETSKFLNEVTGGNDFESGSVDVSPESLYYFYKFAIGGTGKFLNNAAETGGALIDKAQGEDVELESRKIPFVRKVKGETSDYIDQESFYDRYNLVRQRSSAMKDRLNNDKGSSEDRKDYSKVAGISKIYKETAKKLSDIRKEKKKAQKIDDPIRKKERLKKLDEKYFTFIKKANGKFNDRLGENYK